jgi:hypothetical protein
VVRRRFVLGDRLRDDHVLGRRDVYRVARELNDPRALEQFVVEANASFHREDQVDRDRLPDALKV